MEPYIEPDAICKTKVNINYYEYFNTLKYKIKIIIEIFTAIPTKLFLIWHFGFFCCKPGYVPFRYNNFLDFPCKFEYKFQI
jgi:hypothetical protein